MAEIEAITRKWGNSLGITLPKELVDEEHIQENQRIIVEVKQVVDVRSLRGLIKFKKSAQEIKEEMRKSWD